MSYHKYVFDLKNRKFIGKFEEMYQNEDKAGYDSWHQDIVAHSLKYDLILTMLRRYRYKKILDVGCGKGAFTNRLKGELGDVEVTAFDISSTAISKAQQRYSGIDFLVMDISDMKFKKQSFDLVVCCELFWYILNKNVHKILGDLDKVLWRGGHLFVSLYMPQNPIGKKVIGENVKDLKKLIRRYFEIEELVKHEVNDEADTAFILARKKRE